MELDDVRITSDSQLVILQILGIYSANEPSLQKYKLLAKEISTKIKNIEWRHICRKDNRFTDALTFLASMLVDPTDRYINITTLCFPTIKKEEEADIMMVESEEGEKNDNKEDWRSQHHSYLEKGEVPRNRLVAHKLKSRVTNFELREGILYRRSFLGPSLRCLTRKEGMEILYEIH